MNTCESEIKNWPHRLRRMHGNDGAFIRLRHCSLFCLLRKMLVNFVAHLDLSGHVNFATIVSCLILYSFDFNSAIEETAMKKIVLLFFCQVIFELLHLEFNSFIYIHIITLLIRGFVLSPLCFLSFTRYLFDVNIF